MHHDNKIKSVGDEMAVMGEELNKREEFHGFGGVGWELN